MAAPTTYIDGAGRTRCGKCGEHMKTKTCTCSKSGWDQHMIMTLLQRLSYLHWGVEYQGNVEIVKRRWKWTRAQFVYDRKSDYMAVRVSEPLLKEMPPSQTQGFLLHELVHWRLYTTGQPFHDTDTEFVKECLRVGAPLSQTKEAMAAARRVFGSVGDGMHQVAVKGEKQCTTTSA
jgi:predicted SprT family Zn-dependent metalloprotease